MPTPNKSSKQKTSQPKTLFQFKYILMSVFVLIVLITGIAILRFSKANTSTSASAMYPDNPHVTKTGGELVTAKGQQVWRTSVNTISPSTIQWTGPNETLSIWPDNTPKSVMACVKVLDNKPFGVAAKFKLQIVAGNTLLSENAVTMGVTRPFKQSNSGYEVQCSQANLDQVSGSVSELTGVNYRIIMSAGSVDIAEMTRTLSGTVTSNIVLQAFRGIPATFESECLKRSGNKILISGIQNTEFRDYNVAANTIFNAKDAVWSGKSANNTFMHWPIGIAGNGPSCWYGGSYNGTWVDTDANVTWENPYHHSAGMTIRVPNFLLESLRVNNQGDGINLEESSNNFKLRGIYLSNIHDDCIQNDFLNAGILEDSLLEGCYTGFSADDFTKSHNGANKAWTIKNNLVYIKAFPTVFRGPKPGIGVLFKGWRADAPGPQLVLKHNVFMADTPTTIDSEATLGIPKNANLAGCENNIFVWLGKGDFPYSLPSCFTVTKDANLWNNAVASWKLAHPDAAN